MNRYLKILTSFLLLVPVLGVGQEKNLVCGTDDYYQKLLEENPKLRKAEKIADQRAAHYKGMTAKKPPKKRIIPVVFHVIHDNTPVSNISRTRVLSALERINTDLNLLNTDTSEIRPVFKNRTGDYNLEFRLARINPGGKCFNGITRMARPNLTDNVLWLKKIPDYTDTINYWDPEKYLNIWVVEDIYDNNPNSDIAGQANYPWSYDGADGIIMRASEVVADDRTLTHEVGHYLGLKHTFNHGCDSFTNDNGEILFNDEVDDTPPTEERNTTIVCDKSLNTCSDTTNYGRDFPDMVENYMDYTTCGIMFTEGQRNRSQAYFSPFYRGELVSASNLVKTGVVDTTQKPQITRFANDKSYVYPCERVRFQYEYKKGCRNGSLIAGTPKEVTWKFPGAKKTQSHAQSPHIAYEKPGSYPVTLKLSNDMGVDSMVKKDLIHVFDSTAVKKAPFIMRFDENDLLNRGVVTPENPKNYKWQYTSKASANGKGALFLDNYNVAGEQLVSFRLPLMDLSNVEGRTLEFDLAYARKTFNSRDIMDVYMSSDCGKTWENVKSYTFFEMESVDEKKKSPFYPDSEDDWETFKLLLPESDQVLIRFEWTSSDKPGNNVFIDNIRMNYNVGRESSSLTETKIFKISPNPVRGSGIRIKKTGKPSKVDLTVTDMTGQVLFERGDLSLGGNEDGTYFNRETLNILKNGVYLLKFSYDHKIITKKVLFLN